MGAGTQAPSALGVRMPFRRYKLPMILRDLSPLLECTPLPADVCLRTCERTHVLPSASMNLQDSSDIHRSSMPNGWALCTPY